MKIAWLYITTNLINGKKYIGQTTSTRKNYIGSGKVMLAAIKKYGRKNFVRENVYEGDWELIDLMEYELIEKYDAVNSNLFYNQKPGGHKGTHGAAAKKVMSDKAKLRRYSDESKAQRSIRMTGQGNHFYNKNHTDEAKTKIKDKRALQVITEDTKLKISNTIKTLPKFQCSKCHGWYFKRNLVQHHNEKCKKIL
jgi:hypothetical protein